jgi:hypothetical protein
VHIRLLSVALLAGALDVLFAQPPNDVPASQAIAADAIPAHEGLGIQLLRMVQPSQPGPFSQKARLHRYLQNLAGPVPLFFEAAAAGTMLGLDRPPEWGQEPGGYFKRFGSGFAFNGVRSTLSYVTADLSREDNRYFASGKSGIFARVAHALASTAIAHGADGGERISVSAITGVVGASIISRTWSPPNWQGGWSVGRSIAYTFAAEAGFHVFQEFVPDIIQGFEKQKPRRRARSAVSATP